MQIRAQALPPQPVREVRQQLIHPVLILHAARDDGFGARHLALHEGRGDADHQDLVRLLEQHLIGPGRIEHREIARAQDRLAPILAVGAAATELHLQEEHRLPGSGHMLAPMVDDRRRGRDRPNAQIPDASANQARGEGADVSGVCNDRREGVAGEVVPVVQPAVRRKILRIETLETHSAPQFAAACDPNVPMQAAMNLVMHRKRPCHLLRPAYMRRRRCSRQNSGNLCRFSRFLVIACSGPDGHLADVR